MLTRPMRLLFLALLLALACVLLAPRVLAGPPAALPATLPAPPTISDVQPSEASWGTQVTITGSGFGVDKPKVWLQSASTTKHPSLKLLSFSDTMVVALLEKKVAPGSWDVVVQPKAKGSAPMVFGNALAVRAPQFVALDPPVAAPGVTVALHGRFLGTAKGSVKLGGKTAKVLSWTDTDVSLQVPSALKPGAWELVLKNKLGSLTEPCALTVPGSGGTFSGCPDKLTAMLGSEPFSASGFLSVFAFGVMGIPDQLIIVAMQAGPPRVQLQVVIPFDVTMPQIANIVGDVNGFLRVEQGGGPFDPTTTVWTTAGQGDDYSVVITSVDGGKVTGNLQGMLVRVQGSLGGPTLLIPNGTLRATIGP